MISLADAEGSADCFGDDTKAHAAFYSASRSWRTDLSIIVRSIKRLRDCPNGAPISPDPSATTTKAATASTSTHAITA